VRAGFLGQTRPVLWENRVEDSRQTGFVGSGAVIWSGLTDNYLRVLTAAPAGLDLHNRITSVRLARLDGDDLWGDVVMR